MNALVIGSSPTLVYMSYALSCMRCKLTLFPYTDENLNCNKENTIRSGDCKYQFRAYHQIQNLIELSKLLYDYETNNAKFRYILLNYKFLDFLTKSSSNLLRNVIEPSTIILIDSPGIIFDLVSFDSLFPETVILVLHSDIDCKLVDSRLNIFQAVGAGRRICVGTPFPNQIHDVVECLKLQGEHGERLSSLKIAYHEAFSCKSFDVIPAIFYKKFHKSLWENLMLEICIDSVSIIFKQPKMTQLLRCDKSKLLLYDLFFEITSIYKAITKRDMGGLAALGAKKYFLAVCDNETKDIQQELSLSKIKISEELLVRKPYYDYGKGYEISITWPILKLIKIGTELEVEVHTLQQVVDLIADSSEKASPQKSYQVKKRKKSPVQPNFINGIPPEKNMMNYPPFNPLPVPQPPIHFNEKPMIYMCSVEKDNETSDEEEMVDPSLQELVAGSESLTYGADTFYDTEETYSFTPPPPEQIKNIEPVNYPGTDKNTISAPGSPAYFQDPFGNIHLLQPNGTMSPLVPISPAAVSSIISNAVGPAIPGIRARPAPRPYFHVPGPITRSTSYQTLRDSQTHLLNKIHLDRISRISSSTRYGDLDTLTQAMSAKSTPKESHPKPFK